MDTNQFNVGDLVHYHDTYVIPPDAVNWKLVDRTEQSFLDSMAIVVGVKAPEWDMRPYGRHRLYRIMHVKSGYVRTCSSHNLTKAYFYDEIEKE